MKDNVKEELQNEWLKNVIETNNCIEELNKLNEEKQELLNLANSENPPADIIEKLNASQIKFEKLLKKSEEIKAKAKEIKAKIENE